MQGLLFCKLSLILFTNTVLLASGFLYHIWPFNDSDTFQIPDQSRVNPGSEGNYSAQRSVKRGSVRLHCKAASNA